MSEQNEILIYQPNELTKIEVRLANETVWLNQQQIAELFGTRRQAITKHIKNIYQIKELEEDSTCSILELVQQEGKRFVNRSVSFYNLDMIISIGYRVNTMRGIQFRRWANEVLKNYLLKGYSINQRLITIEERIDNRLMAHEKQISELNDKVEFFVHTSLPPKEGIFFEGQMFDAYVLVSDLIRSANNRIVLFDNYIDDSVLSLLDKRQSGVSATIFTKDIDSHLQHDIKLHDLQYPRINIKKFALSHDRFLIIDEKLYHVGASLKDLGKRWFAITLMVDISPEMLLKRVDIK